MHGNFTEWLKVKLDKRASPSLRLYANMHKIYLLFNGANNGYVYVYIKWWQQKKNYFCFQAN